MKKLTIKLTQHTPLIHFQHDQHGATLRASEVKPKLDKFIIQRVFNEEFGLCRYYLVGYDKEKPDALEEKFAQGYRALNYKIKIECERSENEESDIKLGCDFRGGKYVTDDFPLLLSNMGGKKSPDDLVNFSFFKNIVLYFVVKDTPLYDAISANVSCFFANMNFGQRQTKGFGSFTVCKIDGIEKIWNPNEVFENGTPLMSYIVESSGLKRFQDLFSVLDFYWKCLKSGINYTKRKVLRTEIERLHPERYIKAYLWTYLNNKGFTWEKRKLKNELNLIGPCPKTDFVESDNQAFFARGLLGCPINSITYRIPQGKMMKNRWGKFVEETEDFDISISNSRGIERIASPIIFKPVFSEKERKMFVYILFDNLLIEEIKSLANIKFLFEGNGRSVYIDLNSKLIDYPDLIRSYHASFHAYKNRFESVFWNENVKFLALSQDLEAAKQYKFKMIARDHRWENILGDKKVSFFVIKK